MGSTRLPEKILRPIHNKVLLEHILYRLKRLQHKATVVVATSDLKQDDAVAVFCKEHQTHCFRGSERNVLERYYLCAKQFKFDHIVRLTGDNPFTDILELDNLISLHLNSNADFSHSFSNLPIGVGTEIFTFKALEISYQEGHEAHHLEHVDEYLIENPDRFKTSLLEVPAAKNRPDIRLTVDTPEDLEKASFILRNAAADYVTTEEGIRLCLQFA